MSGAEFADESWSARQADALVSMARAYLSGNAGQSLNSSRNTADDHLVTIHVDQSALATGNGRSSLPIENVKRLCCDSHAVVIGEGEGGIAIECDYQNHWFFRRPDGRAVPNCGYQARDMTDDDIGDISDLLNNPPAGGLLTDAKTFVSEPAPLAYWH